MKWQTEVNIAKSNFEINHTHKIISIGSCFSENVGKKFQEHKFNIFLNPFGKIYNPVPIAAAFDLVFKKSIYTKGDLFFHSGLWHSFDHHSEYSSPNFETTLNRINTEIQRLHGFLKEADFLFITFGTSFYFHHTASQKNVANCHKIPGKEFERKLITPQKIAESYAVLLHKLKSFNAKLKVVFTVSPVRYLSFGNFENTISKSYLFAAVKQIIDNNNNVSYFPSYEILMDELRDYRFYASDMTHPNQDAIDYVWEKLSETYFSVETKAFNKQVAQLVRAANHRPFNPESSEHKAFITKTIEKIDWIKQKYPHLNFDEEIRLLKGKIIE